MTSTLNASLLIFFAGLLSSRGNSILTPRRGGSISCELDGPAASLLGKGVILAEDCLYAGFLAVAELFCSCSPSSMALIDASFFIVGVRVKNPMILVWFFCDDVLEVCFLRLGGARAGVEAVELSLRPIL